jgi:hypothetical protein
MQMPWGWNQLDGELRRAWLRAAGVALLAALATGGILSALWRPGTASVQVQAQLAYKAGDGHHPLDFQQLQRQILGDAKPAGASVYRLPSQNGLERIAIDLSTPDETAGLTTVQNLVSEFLARTQHAPTSTAATDQLTAAREELLQTLAQEDRARRAVDSLVKQHIEQLQRVETPVRPIDDAPRAENPTWVQETSELAALAAQRARLLENLTELHPKVLDLSSRIEDLEQRHARTPRFLDGRETDSAAATDRREELMEVATSLAGERGPLRTAIDHYEAARGKRQDAQAAIEILERSPAAAAPSVAPHFELAQAAKVVARVPSVGPLTRMLVLLLVAAIVLAVVTLALRPRRAASLLATAEDVAQWLHVPVVARLKLGRVRA